MNVIRELSLLYHKAHTQICSLGLSSTVGDKLAKLFLGWCPKSPDTGPAVRIRMTYTHEELAEMIGTSRETVTRLLKMFKDRGLIRFDGADLIIIDATSLQHAIASGTLSKKAVVSSQSY